MEISNSTESISVAFRPNDVSKAGKHQIFPQRIHQQNSIKLGKLHRFFSPYLCLTFLMATFILVFLFPYLFIFF